MRLKIRLFTKIEKFIYQFIGYVKHLDSLAKQMGPDNPYKVFLNWLLDVVEYGLPAIICAIMITKLNWLGVAISYGIIRFLFIDLVRQTSKAIKGQE